MKKKYKFKREREMMYSKQKVCKKLLLGKSCWGKCRLKFV